MGLNENNENDRYISILEVYYSINVILEGVVMKLQAFYMITESKGMKAHTSEVNSCVPT